MNRKELETYNKNRKITQVCYVTDNYKKTIEYMTEMLQFGPWTIIENSNETSVNVELYSKKVDRWKFYVAFSFIGDIQIEVIQPVFGPNPYEEFLKTKGPGIHHIKEGIFDNEKLKERIKQLLDMGHTMQYSGQYMEDIYKYLDIYEQTGSYYELGNCADVTDHPKLIGFYPEE